MIKFQDQVPSIYPSASRDFQYLCWLINIVLNSVKHNVDDLYNLPNSEADPRLTELLATTLGFKIKRNYDQKQLRALVAALPKILKYKGTKTAVDMAGNALIASSGATGSFESTVVGGELEVQFPENLVDISLFVDLLPYVLPAGMTCHIIRVNRIKHKATTELNYEDVMRADLIPEMSWDSTKKTVAGLAGLYDVGSRKPEFSNYHYFDLVEGVNIETMELSDRLNAGLLDNTIIPSLTNTLADPTAVIGENDS